MGGHPTVANELRCEEPLGVGHARTLWIPVGFPSPARTTWTHTNTEDSLQGFGLGLGSNFTMTRPYLENQPERLQLHNGALSRGLAQGRSAQTQASPWSATGAVFSPISWPD